jgi:5'-nucleotidase (lipoprotein e(P4) family)
MRHFILALTVLAAFASCQPVKSPHSEPNNQLSFLSATAYTQQSAEYRAVCLQTYQLAGRALTEKIADYNSDSLKPAVVLDLDETVLDNSPYTAWQIANNKPYTTETWQKWTAMGKAKAVPGSKKFLKLADSLDVTIFYLSNRRVNRLEPTVKNMKDLGMPQSEPDHFYLKSSTSDKQPRRDSIMNQGYDILLFCGDNLGDFGSEWDHGTTAQRNETVMNSSSRFGTEFFIFPNPMYGKWDAALLDYNRDTSEAAKNQMRVDKLEKVEIY